MIIFIDDSGDPGFKIEKGSSEIFVIALIIFDDELEAEKTAISLKELRRKLNFPDSVEFKFHKSRHIIRTKFLRIAVKNDFRIRAIVIRKKLIKSGNLKVNKEKFFNYVCKLVLQHHGGTIKHAKLRFDRHGERLIRDRLRVYLSRELSNKDSKIFKDLKFVDSRSNILIQLADMVAGSIAKYYKKEDDRYLEILRKSKKIQDIWEFK